MSNHRLARLLLTLAILLTASPLALIDTAAPVRAAATPLLSETFAGTSVADSWTIAGSACLTAAITSTGSIPACPSGQPGGVNGSLPDPNGQGALRLTTNTGNQSSFAYDNQALPSGQGYVVQFDTAAYNTTSGGTGADGISFFLIDGSYTPTVAGAYGGSLGYAQKTNGTTPISGVVGGYVGIGFDEYGNFANDGEGRGTGCATANKSPNSGLVPQSVTIRGAGSGTTYYCYIANTGTLSQGISVPTATKRASAVLRHVRIDITPNDEISVSMDFHDGKGLVTVIPPLNIAGVSGQPAFPSTFKFGFASSTGGSNNIHEVQNLQVTSDQPDLALRSSHSDPFVAGTTGTYTITATNAITAAPTSGSIVLTDTLPAGLTPLSAAGGTDWNCSIGGQQAVCNYTGTGLSGGQSAAPITVTVAVAHDVSAPTSVTNTVTISDSNDANLADNTASDVTGIVASADLSAGEAVAPNPVLAGQDVTYTATITNGGPSDAANPVATFTLPSAATFVSASGPAGWTCDSAPDGQRHVSCRATNLPLNGTAALALVAAVPSGAANASTVTVPITTSSAASDPNMGNNGATAGATVATAADLGAVMAIAPQPATAGRTLAVTTTVVNAGPSDAQGAVFTTTTPASTTFQALAAPAGWSCSTPGVGATGTVSCSDTAALVAGASAQFVETLALNAAAPDGAPIMATASVAATTSDPNSANNSAAASTTGVRSADLQAAVSAAPNPVLAGQDVTYTAVLTNNGPSEAASPVVTVTLPASATFGALTAPSGWLCAHPAVGDSGAVACLASSLAAGASVSIPVVAHVDPAAPSGATLDGTVAAAGASADPDTSNNSGDASVQVATAADLALTAGFAPAPVTAGQPATETLDVSNAGPSDAQGVVVTTTIPASTTFRTAVAPAGWACDTSNVTSTGILSCADSAALAPGGAPRIVVTLDVASSAADGSALSATAGVSATTADPAPVNNAASASATVATSADLVASAAAAPNPVLAGQDITYTATLTNSGPSDAASPAVTLTVPASTTYVAAAAPAGWACGSPTSGVVTCTAPTLAAGVTTSVPLRVHVDAAVPDGTSLDGSTGATSATTDPDTSNNTATAHAAVSTAADLALTLAGTPNPVVAGRALTATATIVNDGPSLARSVAVSLTVPAGTTFVSAAVPTGWACQAPAVGGTGTVTCTTTGLAVGTPITLPITLNVNPAAPNGSPVALAASAVAATTDPNPANNSATASPAVTTVADLRAAETAPSGPAVAGQTVTYTVVMTNAGPSVAATPVVTVAVPAGASFAGITAPAGWTCGQPNSSGVVSCSKTSMAVGETATFALAVRIAPSVAQGTILTGRAGITSATADPSVADNSASASATASAQADLRVSTTVNATTAQPGARITETTTVTNAGPSDAQNVVFSAVVPAHSTFASLTPPAGWSCQTPPVGGTGTIRCTIPTLAAGAAASFALVVQVDADAPAGTNLGDTATVSSTTADPTSSNNTFAAQVAAVAAPATNTPTSTATTVPTNTPTSTATAPPQATATPVVSSPAVAPSVALLGRTGKTGTTGTYTLSGHDFAPGEKVLVTIDGLQGALVTTNAAANGQVGPLDFALPCALSAGQHTLRVVSSATGHTLTVPVTSGPSIRFTPDHVHPGQRVTVGGAGFGCVEQIALAFDGATLASTPAVVTTHNGSFVARVVVPATLLSGANTVSALGVTTGASASAPVIGRLTPTSAFYFTGASTRDGAQSVVPILNLGAAPARVRFTFYYQEGRPRQASTLVPAHSARVVALNPLVGPNRLFGFTLTSDGMVRAELRVYRPHKDDFAVPGVAAPGTTWYLAEGFTGITFHETVALLNTGTRAARVRLHMLPFSGRTAFGGRERTVVVTIGARRNLVVDVNRLMPHRAPSIIATADRPVVVERTQTFGAGAYGATAQTGVNAPARAWVFAEGETAGRFQTFYTILNPNRAGTRIVARFYDRAGRQVASRSLYLPGLRRTNVKLNDLVRASGVAATFSADRPIVVERPLYFGNPNAPRVAGSVVFGRNGSGLTWAFAGGRAGQDHELVLVYNPSAQSLRLDATFYARDGRLVTRRVTVAAHGRLALDVAAAVTGLAAQHGIVLRGEGGLGFVAEQTVFARDDSTLLSAPGTAS